MKDRPENTHNNQDLGVRMRWRFSGENRFHFCEAREQSRYLRQMFDNDGNDLLEDSPFFPPSTRACAHTPWKSHGGRANYQPENSRGSGGTKDPEVDTIKASPQERISERFEVDTLGEVPVPQVLNKPPKLWT